MESGTQALRPTSNKHIIPAAHAAFGAHFLSILGV
jgi:hypothetical protein